MFREMISVLCRGLTAAVVIGVLAGPSQAVQLNNPSFESPEVTGAPALPSIDGWAEFDAPITNGDQVHGVFPNPGGADAIANVDQQQVAFMSALGGLGIAIAQVSTDTFQVGKSYNVAAWLGKSGDTDFGTPPPDDAEITVRLFYGDVNNALDPAFEIASAAVLAGDLSSAALAMTDFSSPIVQPGDAWADQPIGIAFLPTAGDNFSDPNTFNIDNVSIAEVPEPASIALLSVAGVALLRRRLH